MFCIPSFTQNPFQVGSANNISFLLENLLWKYIILVLFTFRFSKGIHFQKNLIENIFNLFKIFT